MDSISLESEEQTVVINSSVNKSTNGSNKSVNNERNKSFAKSRSTSSLVRPEGREKSVKCGAKTVESRYKQSAQEWANKKRAEETHLSHNSSEGPSSRPPSRNPTPERKKPVKKSSTPLSTDKSLNVSGISVINRVNENKEKASKPELKKYSKPLITGRKSIAPKSLRFDGDSNLPKSGPLSASGSEAHNRNQEFEDSIQRSLYLQSVYLNLKAKEALSERRADAFAKTGAVWQQSNQIRDQLTETQEYVHSLEQLIQTIDILDTQKTYLQKYLDIRTKVDPLFNALSQLIDSQKKLLKIENCSEEDFAKISELLEICPNSGRLERAEMATIALKNAEELVNDIKCSEKEVEECHQKFNKLVKELDRYDRIESQICPEKALSLKKLF